MAPNPAPPAGGKPPGKALSLKSPWTWVIVGGIALVGGAFILYRNRKAAASSTGSASTSSPDYSGALGTLQDEIGNLQSGASGGSGGGTVAVPVTGTTGTDTSGGGGTVTPAAGPDSGGNSPGASGGTSSTSTGSSDGTSTSDTGGGTATATQAPPVAPSVQNVRILSLTNARATVAWDGPGASQWDVVRVGPGSPNGITNRVYAPVAVYTGLASGHNYEIRIYPIVNGQRAGTPGGIDFKTE